MCFNVDDMKKCVIISDSFKGTLTTFDIMRIFTKAVNDIFPSCEVISFPVADGGEGTMEAFASSIKGEIVETPSFDSNFNEIKVSYLMSNNVAYMDVATCIYLATTKIKDPKITTSFGVGLMIKDAIEKGCNKIILGLGGSSTNDAGCGLLSSLGVKFYDENNNVFIPTGGKLDKVDHFDTTEFEKLLENVEIVGMCDVSNPLLYQNGASFVYAKQKGASEEDLAILDKKMEKFNQIVSKHFGKDYSSIPGSGAAGGIGYAILSFLHGHLEKGISTMLEAIRFEEYLKDVDVIFTGEGNVDSQTLNGKVISGIKEVASKYKIPIVVIAGGADISSESIIDDELKAIITTTRKPMEMKGIKPYSEEFYYTTAKNVLRLLKLGESINN